MKKYITEFLKRGMMFAFLGPLIISVIYILQYKTGQLTSVTTAEAAKSIISVTVMAFIAAGITIVYQIEKLPIVSALLIHGTVLYFDYFIVYFINNWIEKNLTAFSIFTLIFILGYAAVWLTIYISLKIKTKRINKKLNK